MEARKTPLSLQEFSTPSHADRFFNSLLVALASFTSRNEMLADWAEDIGVEILDPLKDEFAAGAREEVDMWPVMHLELTLVLAIGVAHTRQPDGAGPAASDDEVNWFAQQCFRFAEPGWRCFRPFDWLATYLTRHRSTAVTAEALLEAAEDTFWGCELRPQ